MVEAAPSTEQHTAGEQWRRAAMRLAVFAVLLILLDQLLGAGLTVLFRRVRTGDMGGKLQLALDQRPDVLVLGSSRAVHHVDGAQLGRDLGQAVYNAGVNGQEIYYAYLLLQLWQARGLPVPKRVLLQIEPTSLHEMPGELASVALFGPLMDESPAVRDVLYSRSRWEPVKYLFKTYRFNGRVLAVLRNQARSAEGRPDGFEPMDGQLPAGTPPKPEVLAAQQAQAGPMDPPKTRMLAELHAWCRDHSSQLVLFHTPNWRDDAVAHAALLAHVAALQQQLPGLGWIDLSRHARPGLADRPELYVDEGHLNREGARLVTAELARQLLRLPKP
ncbi:MAG: hypothetical protein HY902_16695 [Deltaproteobacteria bacterium]|nr:hypothetical protein [Deltaproteobacteria bacterium]